MRLSNLLRDDCRVQNNFVRMIVRRREKSRWRAIIRTLHPAHPLFLSGSTERISNITLRKASMFGLRIEINIFQELELSRDDGICFFETYK